MYAMSWKILARNPAAEILLPRTHADTLIKNKIQFSTKKGNSDGSGCKVRYEEGLPEI
jgi:hypothetical protein